MADFPKPVSPGELQVTWPTTTPFDEFKIREKYFPYHFGLPGSKWSQGINFFISRVQAKYQTYLSYRDVSSELLIHGHAHYLDVTIRLRPDYTPQETEEKSPMENQKLRNAALIIRDDIATVKCQYETSEKPYTFVCPKTVADTLSSGDLVLVERRDGGGYGYQVLKVAQVDAEPDIALEFKPRYAWAIQKVDTALADQLEKETAYIAKQLQHKQNAGTRQQVAQMFGVSNPSALLEDARKADLGE